MRIRTLTALRTNPPNNSTEMTAFRTRYRAILASQLSQFDLYLREAVKYYDRYAELLQR